MSITSVLPLYRARMDVLGYTEWDDAFDFENIPSSVTDCTYAIEVLPSSSPVINQHVLEMDFPITLRVFKNGFSDPLEMRDQMLADLQTIICDILAPAIRLTSDVKNIELTGWSIIPLSDTNDNSAILEMSFINKLVLQGFN